LWHDTENAAALWLIDISFKDNPFHIYALTAGKQTEPQIDPKAVSWSNENYKRSDYDVSAKAWTPDKRTWDTIKQNCFEAVVTLTIIGLRSGIPASYRSAEASNPEILSRASMQLMVSKDPVGAPIFYRDVPLMPSKTSTGVIMPLANEAMPLITWRLRDISKPSACVVLKDMPTCVNCHTFSRDGKVLGMDMDGPRGDKGAYAIAKVEKNMIISADDIITWNSYKYTPKGHMNFGLFSHVSPNGKYVISTLNESTFVANYPDFRFLQSFYPTRGIFAVYYRDTGKMEPLPGANDPNYVHNNACWSPDGKGIVFSRAKAKDNYETSELPKHVDDPNETLIQYDLYTMPFNDGAGGLPTPLEGASQNDMSNSFARYSPDGKWIVFVQTSKGQLMRPDSKLYIIPAQGGKARELSCNLTVMNSWHSWSPNSRWLVFSSKGFTPFTQMFLTHIDENGNDSPAILIPNSTAANRAVNIPEFLYNSPDAIASISTPVQDSYRHFRKAKELADSGQYAEALEELEKSLALNPYYAKAHSDKGYILFRMGKYEKAIDSIEKAIELDPELAMAYYDYGSVLEAMGRIDEAISMYKRVLEIEPRFPGAMNNMAKLLKNTGRLEEAASMMRRAAEIWEESLGPNHPQVAGALGNLAGLLEATGHLEEAEVLYRRAVKIFEESLGPEHSYTKRAKEDLERLLKKGQQKTVDGGQKAPQ
jgi:tetratricopeptide (TPR) repeat protein